MPIDIKESTQGDIVILDLTGSIEAGTAPTFEQNVTARLDAGARRFVIDFRGVDLLTSAGIRVLLMLAKRLEQTGGRLLLSALNDHLRTVLEIAGLTDRFPTAPSKGEAVARLSEGRQPSDGPSGLSSLVLKLLSQKEPSARAQGEQSESRSESAWGWGPRARQEKEPNATNAEPIEPGPTGESRLSALVAGVLRETDG